MTNTATAMRMLRFFCFLLLTTSIGYGTTLPLPSRGKPRTYLKGEGAPGCDLFLAPSTIIGGACLEIRVVHSIMPLHSRKTFFYD